MSSLKLSNDGLSKDWEAQSSLKPFYNGGKISLLNNGKSLACLYNESLNIVNLETSEIMFNVMKSGSETEDLVEGISCFCIHPNGEEIVVATVNYLLKHCNWKTNTTIRTIRNSGGGNQMPVSCMDYDSSGTLVATGSTDSVVRVWDIVRGYCTHTFRQHTATVTHIQFMPPLGDSKNVNDICLCSCSDDNTVIIHDLGKNKCTASFRQHTNAPTGFAFSWGGSETSNPPILVSAGRDKVLHIMDCVKMSYIKGISVTVEEIESVNLISCSTSDKKKDLYNYMALCGTISGAVLIIGFTLGKVNKELSLIEFDILHQSNANPFATAKSLSVTSDNIGASAVNKILVHKDSNMIVFGTNDHVLYLNELTYNGGVGWPKLQYKGKQLTGFLDDILDLSILNNSSDGLKLSLLSNSNVVRLLQYPSLHTYATLEGHSDIVLSLDQTADGSYLVTSSKDRTCRVWIAKPNEISCGAVSPYSGYAVAIGHTDAVGCVCISQRESSFVSKQAFIVSGSADKVLKRWALPPHSETSTDILQLMNTHSVRAHEKDINTVACAPNDSMVASGSQDKTIKLWKSSDMSLLATLSGHKRGIWKVVFSTVDKSLLSASGDRTIRLWSLADYSCVRTFQGHASAVLNCKFICNGLQLLSTSSDGSLKLWTVRTGACENTYDSQHSDRIWALAVTSDDDSVCFTAGTDSTICCWKDVTVEKESERLKESENKMLLEQQLMNDIRRKDYGKALIAALNLNHSSKVYQILTSILENDSAVENDKKHEGIGSEKEFDVKWSRTVLVNQLFATSRHPYLTNRSEASVSSPSYKLDSYVATLSPECIVKLLSYVNDWNTNAKYSHTSQFVVDSMLRKLNLVKKFFSADDYSQTNDSTQEIRRLLPKIVPSLVAYSERHYQRLNKLSQASYLVDYVVGAISNYVEHNSSTNAPSKLLATDKTGKKRANITEDDSDDDGELKIVFKKAKHDVKVSEKDVSKLIPSVAAVPVATTVEKKKNGSAKKAIAKKSKGKN